MDDDPTERDFAAAAWNHVSAPPGRYDPVLVPAPPLRRLSAALIDGALIVFVAGPVAAIMTFILVMSFVGGGGTEFVQWLLLSVWGVLAVAYGYVEAFGRVTIGKKMQRLRLVDIGAPPPGRGRRFTLRWVLGRLPLLALVTSCVGITSHASTLGWDDFLDNDLLYFPAALLAAGALHAVIGVACVAGPWRMTPWERLTGVELRHALPLIRRDPRRGFEVVPVAAALRADQAPLTP